MHRFYFPHELLPKLVITGDIYHQIVHVFRAKVGDQYTLFTNGGPDVVYEIMCIHRDVVECMQVRVLPMQQDVVGALPTLFQATLHRMSCIEYLIEKACEIGVGEIVFFRAQYSQKIDALEKKMTRLQHIAQEAIEQSGRNMMPRISYVPDTIENLIASYPGCHVVTDLTSCPLQKIGLSQISHMWVGPEGGWSQSEREVFRQQGVSSWQFGDAIMRAETAATVGLGILAHERCMLAK